MTQHTAAAAQQSAELIANVGHIADRLLATCTPAGAVSVGSARPTHANTTAPPPGGRAMAARV